VLCVQLLLTVWAAHVTINILPDDLLLHIFHFNRLLDANELWRLTWKWDRLAHVCRRWRFIVFASPNFLDLKLVYTPRTRAELMGIWPPLPIVIMDSFGWPMSEDYDFGAVIVHPNRVCQIKLSVSSLQHLQQLAQRCRINFRR
jgi:hypothetical protein